MNELKTVYQKIKANYVIMAESGLLEDAQWKLYLDGYSTEIVETIRKRLKKRIRGLSEKFNHNSRYFGFRKGDDADKVYIYVQKKDYG